MLREGGATCEVDLPAGGRPVARTERFGRALAEEVDLERGVDRDHVVLTADVARIVGVVDRPELDPGVVADELEQSKAAERRGRNALAAVSLLGGAGHGAALDEVDEALAEELGVHAEIAVAGQQ